MSCALPYLAHAKASARAGHGQYVEVSIFLQSTPKTISSRLPAKLSGAHKNAASPFGGGQDSASVCRPRSASRRAPQHAAARGERLLLRVAPKQAHAAHRAALLRGRVVAQRLQPLKFIHLRSPNRLQRQSDCPARMVLSHAHLQVN